MKVEDFNLNEGIYSLGVEGKDLEIRMEPSTEGWQVKLIEVNNENTVAMESSTGFVVPGGMTDDLRAKALEKAVTIANELLERYEQAHQAE